jgi:hypothetical protein
MRKDVEVMGGHRYRLGQGKWPSLLLEQMMAHKAQLKVLTMLRSRRVQTKSWTMYWLMVADDGATAVDHWLWVWGASKIWQEDL